MNTTPSLVHDRLRCILLVLALLAVPATSIYAAGSGEAAKLEMAPRPQIAINILGQVVKPDRVQLPDGSTVLDALATAGGPGKYANQTRARILRKDAESVETIVINLKDMLAGKTAATLLRDGDTFVLDEQYFR